MSKEAAKKATKTTSKTTQNSDLDQLYSILHQSDAYKEMVKAGKVPKTKNGVRIG